MHWYAILLNQRFGHIAAHWVEADEHVESAASHRFLRADKIVYSAAPDMVKEVRKYDTRDEAVADFKRLRARHGMSGSKGGGVAVNPRSKGGGGVLEQGGGRFGPADGLAQSAGESDPAGDAEGGGSRA